MAAPRRRRAIEVIAAYNRVDKWLFRRELNTWLTEEIMQDRAMTEDFRIAMAQLCLTRLSRTIPMSA